MSTKLDPFDESQIDKTGAANGALTILRNCLAHGLEEIPFAVDRGLTTATIGIPRVRRPPPVTKSKNSRPGARPFV
jgi:hypothetical protein